MLLRAFNDNYSTIISLNLNKPFLLGSTINRDDERLLFREVEKVLESLCLDPELIQSAIEPIRQYIIREQRPNCADFLNYLNEIEKAPHHFKMNKVFSYVPLKEKYLLIDSIFSRLALKEGRLDFTLRSSFSLLLKSSINKSDNSGN